MKIRYLISSIAIATAALGSDLKTEEFSGLHLVLVHETNIETYKLVKGGTALAQFGVKNGPITGSVCRWKLEGDFLVFTGEKSAEKRLEVVEKDEKSLKLRRPSGEVAVFEIAKKEE